MKCAHMGLTALAAIGMIACNETPVVPADQIPITTSSQEALREYLEGRDLLENLRGTDANERFSKAVELDPTFALAWLGMANTSGSPSEFFSALERANELAEGASEGEALLIRAVDAGVNADPERQRELLERLVDRYPADERAHFQLGVYYFGRQDWEPAIEHYKRAIALDTNYPPPYNQLGYSLRNLERYPEAEEALKKYVELIPNEPNPHDSYAELLMKVGRFHESIAEYNRALEINPNFTASYIGLGHDQIFLGQMQEARNTFARLAYIARNDGERRQAHTWAAASYIYEGAHDQALAEIEKRLQLAKEADDWFAATTDHNLLGFVLLNAGRPDEALRSFEMAIETIEKAYTTDEVRETFRRNHLYNRCRVALDSGAVDEAADLAESYRIEVDEHQVAGELRAVHDLQGRIALARGQWAAAVDELSQANQQNPQILYLLAQACERSGDLAAARTWAGRSAHFNGLSFAYALVRGDAMRMLERLDRESGAAGAIVPALPRPPRTAVTA